jgi:hypothetical protein
MATDRHRDEARWRFWGERNWWTPAFLRPAGRGVAAERGEAEIP